MFSNTCTIGDVEDADLTPEFDYYADDVEDGFDGTTDKTLPPTPEVNDNYVGENVILPRGNYMVQGRFCKRARDNDGIPIVRENEKTILNIREYVVEFKYGKEAELYSNAIAQIMYAQCDPDGHTYVLFDSLTNLRRSKTALCYAYQTVRKAYGRTFFH